MYKIFLLICFPMLVFSQKRIEGTIIDAEQEKLPQVAVEVYDSQNKLIKTLITDGQGNFVLESIGGDSAKLIVNDLEYARLEKVFNPEKQDGPLVLILKKETQDIQAVTLTKQKPLVKRKIDRLEFNVENSNITSLNVWEILKKTPGVTANNDVLGIKGSTSILVTINDKKVMLTGDELKNFLENIQGEELKSVEVITNPPAKYEASGSAVLNIVMKKIL
ncbi:hypothetical protein MUU74_02510 [Chryseobacterium daecheongense]|uniref:carboxypeptidase-like regulatory domain-containing protein n=1 Tax=Chryseobacterium daecheongense TaxID=192389 RepID=UPI001FD6E847|nr:hypothetical protein [Chryseobacterium daecheongense]UOU98831.1 hypothetical protein MUU74_02510 [Chryseobacterium daecheongense]